MLLLFMNHLQSMSLSSLSLILNLNKLANHILTSCDIDCKYSKLGNAHFLNSHGEDSIDSNSDEKDNKDKGSHYYIFVEK
jgi:hypothetical protein